MTRQKIVLTIQEFSYGGASKQVFWLMQYLCQQGFEVVLISNAKDTWLGSQLRAHALPVKAYYSSWIQRAFNPLKEIGVIFFIVYVLCKEKPHNVLLGGAKLLVQGGIAAWLCQVPGRFIHLHGLGAPSKSLMLSLSQFGYQQLAKMGFQFVTVSQYDYQFLSTQSGISSEQIYLNRNGIDIDTVRTGDRTVLRKQYNIPSDAFVIGMVGRFGRHKRYDWFLQMLNQLCPKNAHVYGLLIGEGPDRDKLQRQINQSGYRDRVFVTGFIENVADIYAALDLSVLLTDFEGLSNVLCESIAAGLPVITNPVCGNPEVVIHGENGYLVKTPDEAVVYAQKLIDDPRLCLELGLRGKQIATDQFNATTQIKQMVDKVLTGKAFK